MILPRLIPSLFVAVLTLAPSTLASWQAKAADAVFPVGSLVGLTPPAGMVASRTFPGFEDREKKAGIVITQLPGEAYEQFLKSMNSGAIELPGVSNAKREILLTEGGAAHLLTGDQEAEGVKFRKWMLITRRAITGRGADSTMAFVVTAQVPIDAEDAYSDADIRKALGSVALRANVPTKEILDNLPFEVNELAKFEGVRSLIPGQAIMLTEQPGMEPPVDRPFLMISVGGPAPSQASDRAAFATNILRGIQGFKNLKPVFAEPMRIGGKPGYEIRLEGQTMAHDTDVMIVQWMRFSGTGFIRVVGVSPKKDWGETFTRFRAVRDGIDTR
ncbi:hypothetical protein [Pseudorhodoplanes sinuspersici]|uniref:Uncharacterized protein n=1 Tax=Pseudorhodoplanes sinuspersici TaxID=1235591 RepID=A0A1W6ZPL2_9HYPH|nr:hypothetical protein [Pseudorhodoplanes sinuspersici]ARP99187.1 hypothetical protein CAK95_08885 [Pseudorhodoplanes sinuspersici]RKE69152.1 hypothetical protein DFP91_3579 [Pseudorhodoplanes sinuspersici]